MFSEKSDGVLNMRHAEACHVLERNCAGLKTKQVLWKIERSRRIEAAVADVVSHD